MDCDDPTARSPRAEPGVCTLASACLNAHDLVGVLGLKLERAAGVAGAGVAPAEAVATAAEGRLEGAGCWSGQSCCHMLVNTPVHGCHQDVVAGFGVLGDHGLDLGQARGIVGVGSGQIHRSGIDVRGHRGQHLEFIAG